MPLAQLAPAAITVIGTLIALVVLIKGARGRPRIWGAVGTFLILLGVLSRVAFQWTVERFLGKFDDAPVVTALAVEIAASGLLIGIGLIMVTRAMVLAGQLRSF